MISRRALAMATAALTGAFGAAVVVSSFENGIGWSSAGVDAGTFPFITGCLILAGSLYNLVQGWFAGRAAAVSRHDLQRIAALFVPSVAYVAAIPFVGMYVASTGYVFGTLFFQSRMPPIRSAAMALLTSVALYALFEWMFQVSLPRGRLGDALGF